MVENEERFVHVGVGVVAEQQMEEQVTCEIRDGVEFYVFRVRDDRCVVAPVAQYDQALRKARENPVHVATEIERARWAQAVAAGRGEA
jgi:hypothetical protein